MKLSEVSKIFRITEWWSTKVPMLLGVFCFSFLEQPRGIQSFFVSLLLLILWTAVTASFGFFLNEVYDIDQDILSGKKNFTGNINKKNKLSISLFLALTSILIWLPHSEFKILMGAAVFQLLLFCVYSIPPIRLKEKVWGGVVIDSLYAFVIPLIIAFCAAKFFPINIWHGKIFLLLIGWSFAAGVRNILQHHIADRKFDRNSGVKNLANIYGVPFVAKLSRFMLLVELPLFIAYFYFNPGNIFVKIVLLLLYFLFNSSMANRFGIRFNFKRKLASLGFNFNSLYEVWLLIAGTLFLSAYNKIFSFLFLFELILFRNEAHYLLITIATSFYFKILCPIPPFVYYKILNPVWHHGILKATSFVVNYSIYYFRIIILRQDENTARKAQTVSTVQKKNREVTEVPFIEKKDTKTVRSVSEIIQGGKMLSENLIVNSLWIGNHLSRLELLTIESFIRQGHHFRLWAYEKIKTPLPNGVELMNANTILDKSKIFRYKGLNKYGHGKGSVSGFSDIFRYKLLYEYGGWWVDMDVTCLKPLNFETEYFFRSHHDLLLVGNVMKSPKGCKLMHICYEQAALSVNENNTDWLKPIQILNDNVIGMGLTEFVFKDFSNQDHWDKILPFVSRNKKISENYFLIHWMNEEWRSRGIDKNDIRPSSTLGQLLVNFGILVSPPTKFAKLKTDMRHLFYIPLYEYFSTNP